MGSRERSGGAQLARAFTELELTEPWLTFVTERYLRGVDGFERAATWHLLMHNRLRLAATVAGLGTPVLIGVQLATAAPTINWVAFGLSLTAAVCLGINTAFRLGDRWRHNRRTAEALKQEGWFFYTLSGPYDGLDRKSAAPRFHARVERVVEHHVDVLLDEISRESGGVTTQ